MTDPQLDRIQRKIEKQQRKLEERKRELEQQAVHGLPPRQRKRWMRRRMRELGLVGAILGFVEWARRHPTQTVTVAAMSALVGAFFILPITEDEPDRIYHPPVVGMPSAPPLQVEPKYTDVTADVATPEPTTEPTIVPAAQPPEQEPPSAPAPGVPSAPESPASAKTPADTAPGPEPGPQPEDEVPEPEKTEPPETEPPVEEPPEVEPPGDGDDDDKDKARERCLRVLVPRVDLGECARKLLGLLD